MLPKSKYLCFCADCKNHFLSDKMPIPKKNVFSKLGIFQKRRDDSTSVEAHSLCVSSASVEKNKLESSVQCPKCGGRNVILEAIAD
jgi:hypothetical protein